MSGADLGIGIASGAVIELTKATLTLAKVSTIARLHGVSCAHAFFVEKKIRVNRAAALSLAERAEGFRAKLSTTLATAEAAGLNKGDPIYTKCVPASLHLPPSRVMRAGLSHVPAWMIVTPNFDSQSPNLHHEPCGQANHTFTSDYSRIFTVTWLHGRHMIFSSECCNTD